MKLLPKQKIQASVEDQRRIQIEEGITLAKKIDALREKLADLQKQHDLFVMGMEESLKAKTEKLFEEIQERETEIKLLEVKRKELLKPLDDAWKAVEIREIELSNLKVDLETNLTALNNRERRIEERDKDSNIRIQHIKVRERELERTFDKAEQLRIESEKGFLKMSNDKEIQDEAYYKKNKELILRESSITSYEFTLKQREEHIEIAEKEIADEKVRLLDQRQTLERAMARLNK